MASYRVYLPDLISHSEGENGWIKPGEFLLRAKQYLLRVFIENQAIFIESQGPASSDSQSVVPRLVASTSSGNWSERQILRPQPQNLWGLEHSNLCFNWPPKKSLRDKLMLRTTDPGRRSPGSGEAGNQR